MPDFKSNIGGSEHVEKKEKPEKVEREDNIEPASSESPDLEKLKGKVHKMTRIQLMDSIHDLEDFYEIDRSPLSKIKRGDLVDYINELLGVTQKTEEVVEKPEPVKKEVKKEVKKPEKTIDKQAILTNINIVKSLLDSIVSSLDHL